MCRAMIIEVVMRQKGFATVFGLCLILIIAVIVKGIQESEANHAREVLNFEMEQALQSAAESGIVTAVETGILTSTKEFKFGEPPNETTIYINIEVRRDSGNIYHYNKHGTNTKFKIYDENGTEIGKKDHTAGVYFMSRAEMDSSFFGKKIYRRAYAYIIDDSEVSDDYKDKIYFMELP